MKTLLNYILENSKTYKIAYVHGYGGSAVGKTVNEFRSLLPKGYEVLGIDYDNDNPKKALQQIRDFVEKNDIDMLFATSYGSWLIMMLPEYKRVVMNPCFHPQNELIRWPVEEERVPDDVVKKIKEVDDTIFSKSNTEESKNNLYAFFAKDDDFLGDKYQSEFKKDWYTGDNMKITSGGHSPSKTELQQVIKYIETLK